MKHRIIMTIIKKIIIFSFAGLLTACSANAQIAIKPTLTLDFEKGVDGIGQNGQEIKARVEGNVDLQNGKFGKALKSGPGGAYLYFPTKNIVSPQAGTVEMWVCPLDWNGAEEAFHMFFKANGIGEKAGDVAPKGSLYLYKYYKSVLELTMLTSNGGTNKMAFSNVDAWKPGEWHFIAGTWSPALQSLYIDGKRVGNTLPNLPQALTKEFMIGDNPWGTSVKRSSNSLIDNVRIYDRQLSPEIIAAHYKGDYDAFVGISDKTTRLDFTVHLQQKKIQPVFTLMGAETDISNAEVDFTVSRDGRIIQTSLNNGFHGVVSEGELQDNMPPGTYELKASVHDKNGENLGEVNKELVVPSREWMGNTLGEEKKVLAPWTPLKIIKNAPGNFVVEVWGRQYQFHNSLFPTQIIAQNKPMLQSPIALKVLLDNKELPWTNTKTTLQNASDYEANIVSSATLNTPQGKVLLETKFHIEYDGLIVADFTMRSPAGFKPDQVSLEIPLRSDVAIYRHGWDAAMKPNAGMLPAGGGIIEHDMFRPAAWLGDNDRGLFWFCETAQFWPNWQKDDAFQIRRQSGAVALQLNLLHGQDLPATWKFESGLQATPVKPRPANWRQKRLAPPDNLSRYQVLWPTAASNSQKYYGYPEATDSTKFQKRVDDLHAINLGVVPYLCLTAISSAAPEWKWFGDEWSTHKADGGSSDVAAMGASFEYVSVTQKSWRDFIIWKNKQFLDRYKLNGSYHDLTYPRGYAVPSANTGWFDGKAWQKTYPILAMRDLYRRLYAVTKAADPNALLIGHIYGWDTIPVIAYEDAYLDGERARTPMVGKSNYTDVLPLDVWRTQYTGRQWGPIPIFLPEFDAAHRQQTKPTRGLAGLALLHDTTIWPVWCNTSVIQKLREEKDAFGLDNAAFIPYFDATPPASTDMKDVYISAYKKPDGKVLLAVVNTSSEPRDGAVTINVKRLGIKDANIMDWPTKKSSAAQGNVLQVKLDGLDYQLFTMDN